MLPLQDYGVPDLVAVHAFGGVLWVRGLDTGFRRVSYGLREWFRADAGRNDVIAESPRT